MYVMILVEMYQSIYILEYNKAWNMFIFIKCITVKEIIVFIQFFQTFSVKN